MNARTRRLIELDRQLDRARTVEDIIELSQKAAKSLAMLEWPPEEWELLPQRECHCHGCDLWSWPFNQFIAADFHRQLTAHPIWPDRIPRKRAFAGFAKEQDDVDMVAIHVMSTYQERES